MTDDEQEADLLVGISFTSLPAASAYRLVVTDLNKKVLSQSEPHHVGLLTGLTGWRSDFKTIQSCDHLDR